MSKCVNSAAGILPKGSVSQLGPAGSRAGLFLLRRACYFKETGFDAAGRVMRDAECSRAIAEATADSAKPDLIMAAV